TNAARRLWPEGSPIGKRFRWDGPANNPWITVVGVVGDVRDRTDDREARAIYIPMDQSPNVYMYFAMRTTGDPVATMRAAEQSVFAIDPTQPVTQVRTLGKVLDERIAGHRIGALLVAAFALLALVLAAVGIYGVASTL